MKISWRKIFLFFLALAVLGWFLYPRDLFLGFIYEGLTELKQSEKHYQEFLAKRPYNKFATLRLANLYDRMGEPQKATTLLKNLYEHRKSDWSVAERYLDHLKNLNDTEALQESRLSIARYYISQPRIPKRKVGEMLYDAYLQERWEQNNEEAYAILLDLMKVSRDPKPYVEEMINMHRGLQNLEELKIIFQKRVAENPKDIENRLALAEIYMAMEDWDGALKVIDETLALAPESATLWENKIYVDLKRGDKRGAIKDIEHLLSIKDLEPEERFNQMDKLGFLYYSLGDKKRALSLYQEALKGDPDNQERWIHVASLLSSMKRSDEAIALLKQYEEKFGPDFEEQKLLAEIYLYDKKDLAQIPFYKKYVSTYHQPVFALDVGYLLLDEGEEEKAMEWLEFAHRQFGDDPKIAEALSDIIVSQEGDKAYALMEKKKYKEAIPHLEKMTALKPEEKVIHRDLGEAYTRSGYWQKGMREYELGEAKEPLKELHKTHDHRVKGLYGLTDYGSEEYMEWGGSYQGYFSEPLEFKGEVFLGRFTSPAAGFEGEAEYGKFLLASHHLEKWIFDGGAGFGFSNRRETISPFADVAFAIPDLLLLKAGYQYRQLRTDLPQAVAQGDLIDTARFNGQWLPWERLNLGVMYEFVRDYLPAGQKAYEHQLEPTINFVITKKPYFTIGYQYTFIQVYGTQNFLTLVPLIQKMRAHYGTGYLGWQIVENFLFEASGFIGEDTARDLQFVSGDLWGAHAGISWNITSWCDLDVGYDYGREVLFNVPGRFQHVAVGLSGHWF